MSGGPSRRAMLGGLAAIPAITLAGAAVAAPAQPARAKWDRRLKRYTILKALSHADTSFGTHAASVEAGKVARYQIEADYGSWSRAQAQPDGAARCEAIYATEDAADSAYCENFLNPADRAAILLAMTPAPDVEAALYKIEMMKAESLDNHTWMPRDCMEIVREDMARLRSAA